MLLKMMNGSGPLRITRLRKGWYQLKHDDECFPRGGGDLAHIMKLARDAT